MGYTFNEAFKQVEDNINYCDDNAFEQWYELLEKLQQEYAPTILLTKNQYQEFKRGNTLEGVMARMNRLADNSSEDSADAYINDDMIMRAYLHPETIKVINEENK